MTAATDDARRRPGSSAGTGPEAAERTMWPRWPGTEPPPEGMWLWATEVDGEPGGVFTARRLPAERASRVRG